MGQKMQILTQAHVRYVLEPERAPVTWTLVSKWE